MQRSSKTALCASRDRSDLRTFAWITLTALILRLAFIIPVRPLPVSDFGWYYERALGLAHGIGYTLHGHPTALWPPGWPYVLAATVWLFGPSIFVAELMQALLNSLTAGFAFLIAFTLFGRTCGIAAGISYAVLPSAVEWCATLASEPLYTLLWVIVTFIWISRPLRDLGWFAISGVLLGAAALVRPSALLYWTVPLALALLSHRERRRLPAWAAAMGTTVACMVIVILPMIARNYRAFGTFVVISNNGGVSLYEGNNPQSNGTDSILYNPQIQKLLENPRTEAAADQLASRLAVEYIVTHPQRELLLVLRRLKALYSRDDSVIRFTLRSRHFRELHSPPPSDRLASALVVVNTVFYYLVMVFAVTGVVLSLLRSRQSDQDTRRSLVLGLILYNTLVFAVLTAVERYRYPTMPYFCVFAAVGMVAVWGFLRGRRGGEIRMSEAQRASPETAVAAND